MTTTRDTLQQREREIRGMIANPPSPSAAIEALDERIGLLEEAVYDQGQPQTAVSQPRRGPGEIVGTILATVNLLSATAVLWLLVLGMMDTRTGTVAFTMFVLMAITGGVIATKTPKAKTT